MQSFKDIVLEFRDFLVGLDDQATAVAVDGLRGLWEDLRTYLFRS